MTNASCGMSSVVHLRINTNAFCNIPTTWSTNLYLDSFHSFMASHSSQLNPKRDHKFLLVVTEMCVPIYLACPPEKQKTLHTLDINEKHPISLLSLRVIFMSQFPISTQDSRISDLVPSWSSASKPAPQSVYQVRPQRSGNNGVGW